MAAAATPVARARIVKKPKGTWAPTSSVTTPTPTPTPTRGTPTPTPTGAGGGATRKGKPKGKPKGKVREVIPAASIAVVHLKNRDQSHRTAILAEALSATSLRDVNHSKAEALLLFQGCADSGASSCWPVHCPVTGPEMKLALRKISGLEMSHADEQAVQNMSADGRCAEGATPQCHH